MKRRLTLAVVASVAALGISAISAGAKPIGSDTRTRVYNTTDSPWRGIVHITFKKYSGSSTYGCSGFLIDRNTVATAGHCLRDPGAGARSFPVSSYRIYPGRNG